MRRAELPLEDVVYPYLEDPRSVGAVAQTCVAARALSLQNNALAWAPMVQRRWGPVTLTPSVTDWRALARHLETVVRPLLSTNVLKAIGHLLSRGLLPRTLPGKQTGRLTSEPWVETVRCCLAWGTLDERRRLTAYLCLNAHPPAYLQSYFAVTPIRGATPLVALRDLLLRFPFLPIDAGQGADRVVGCFARAYALQNPDALAAIVPASTKSYVSGTSSASDPPSDDDEEEEEEMERRVRRMMQLHLSGVVKAGRDAVYTLTYSLIMLNTDLHKCARQRTLPSPSFTSLAFC